MSADNMPPLPEPAAWRCDWRGDNDSSGWEQWHDAADPMPAVWDGTPPDEVTLHYTADQMHAYARAYAAEQTRELVGSVGALLFVVRALATELGIDPETTEFRFSADGKEFAQTTLSTICENADAILAKHKAQS